MNWRILVFVLFFIFSHQVFAQRGKNKFAFSDLDHKNSIFRYKIPRIGLSFQDNLYGELDLLLAKSLGHSNYNTALYRGWNIGVQGCITSVKWIVAPKLGYEWDTGLFGYGINLNYFTDFSSGDLRLTPEAGLCILGFINLFGGYNIPLTSTRLIDVGNLRISLVVSLSTP